MENKPRQPPAPPESGTSPNVDNGAEHGIPPGMHDEDADATATPDSGRGDAEIAPTKP